MVDLRQLQYFVAVSEEGSFVKAATRQHITQSALSQQIARLEREWGVVLFARGVRGAVLTPAGAELIEDARAVLHGVRNLQAKAGGLARRAAAELLVGSATYAVRSRGRQRAVAEFSAAHPEVGLRFTNAWSPQLLEMLVEGEVDLAFAMLAPESDLLDYLLMEDEAAALVVPTDHPLSASARVGLADLRGERVLLHPRSVNSWTFEVMSEWLARHGAVVAELEETSLPGIIEQVRAGSGLFPAVPWELDFVNPAELSGLTVVPTTGEEGLRYRLWLARRKAGATTPHIDAFWALAGRARAGTSYFDLKKSGRGGPLVSGLDAK
jgi:DNA-binding transcriptional LysR family regulator